MQLEDEMKIDRRYWKQVYDALGELWEEAIEKQDLKLEQVLSQMDDLLKEVDPDRREA